MHWLHSRTKLRCIRHDCHVLESNHKSVLSSSITDAIRNCKRLRGLCRSACIWNRICLNLHSGVLATFCQKSSNLVSRTLIQPCSFWFPSRRMNRKYKSRLSNPRSWWVQAKNFVFTISAVFFQNYRKDSDLISPFRPMRWILSCVVQQNKKFGSFAVDFRSDFGLVCLNTVWDKESIVLVTKRERRKANRPVS